MGSRKLIKQKFNLNTKKLNIILGIVNYTKSSPACICFNRNHPKNFKKKINIAHLLKQNLYLLYWASSRNQKVRLFFHHFLINQTKLRTLNKQEINRHRKQDHVECKNWQTTNQDENRKRLKICTSTFSEWNHQM